MFWFIVILLIFPVIRWAVYWVTLAVAALAIMVWRLLTAPAVNQRREVMATETTKGLVGRRVEYLEEDLKPVGGEILAVHNWRGRRRFFIKWDDKAPRESFVHEGHPLLTLKF